MPLKDVDAPAFNTNVVPDTDVPGTDTDVPARHRRAWHRRRRDFTFFCTLFLGAFISLFEMH